MPARAELDAGGASRQVRLLNLPTRDGAGNVGEEPHSHFNYEWDNLAEGNRTANALSRKRSQIKMRMKIRKKIKSTSKIKSRTECR
jgi:hypothetical protein